MAKLALSKPVGRRRKPAMVMDAAQLAVLVLPAILILYQEPERAGHARAARINLV